MNLLAYLSMQLPCCWMVWLVQVALSRSLMGDAAAVKALQNTPIQAVSSLDHGGLVCAACNGVWICPRYKDKLYVCRGTVIGRCTRLLLVFYDSVLHTCYHLVTIVHVYLISLLALSVSHVLPKQYFF